MVLFFLQQRNPPVIPVLQEVHVYSLVQQCEAHWVTSGDVTTLSRPSSSRRGERNPGSGGCRGEVPELVAQHSAWKIQQEHEYKEKRLCL